MERFGALKLVREGVVMNEPIAGIPEVFSAGQGGLLDVSAHPDFANNQLVYLSFAHGTEENNRLRVVRGRLDNLTFQ